MLETYVFRKEPPFFFFFGVCLRCSKQFQLHDLKKVLFFTRTTKIYAFWSNSGKKYTLEDVGIGGSINQGTRNGWFKNGKSYDLGVPP